MVKFPRNLLKITGKMIMVINEVRHLLTYRCNLKCRHCYLSAGENVKDGETEITQEWADKFYGFFKPESVSATGGEPLLKISEVKILARSTAKYNGALEVVTNGLLLTEKLVNELNSINKKLYYQISLDGLEEYHDFARQKKGAFKKAIEAIELASSSGRKTKARMTVTPENYKQIPQIIELLDSMPKSQNIKLVMRPVLSTGRAKKNELRFEKNLSAELKELKKHAKNIDMSVTDRCGYCLDSITINPYGEIFPCCYFVFNPEFKMGNIFDDPKALRSQEEFANYTGKCFAVDKFSKLDESDNRCETCIEKDFIRSNQGNCTNEKP